MMRNYIVKTIWAMAFTVAGVLSSVVPAQAGIVTGDFDPTYGAPFAGSLSYRGSFTLNVDATCLASPGLNLVGPPPCASATNNFVSAFVDFYVTSDPFKTSVEQLNFTGLMNLTAINIVAGSVDYIVANSTAPVSAVGGNALDVATFYGAYKYDLTFNSGWAYIQAKADPGNPLSCTLGVCALSNPATVHIPEPESMALVLSALFALGMSRRRRA